MRKRMKRYLSLCLSLCMLVMVTPPIGLAEDGTAPVAAAEQAAVLEPQAAAGAADVTPAAAAAPDPAATPETTPDPDAASEPYVVLQAEPDATPDPDATAVPDADSTPEDDATPDPDATPEPEGSAVPSVEPTVVSSEPTPVGIEELPPVEEEASDEPAMLEAADITITNSHGVLSYAVPEGVTVEKQQWRKNSTDIAGATGPSYTLTMDDMMNRDNVLSVRLTLSNSTVATSAGYSMSANDEWEMDVGTLTFTGGYDQKTTGFPLKLDDIYIETVVVASGASVTGVNLPACGNLTNYGTITDSNLNALQLFTNGTISGSSLTVNGNLDNFGVIYKSGIDCSDVYNENGVIHVREHGWSALDEG